MHKNVSISFPETFQVSFVIEMRKLQLLLNVLLAWRKSDVPKNYEWIASHLWRLCWLASLLNQAQIFALVLHYMSVIIINCLCTKILFFLLIAQSFRYSWCMSLIYFHCLLSFLPFPKAKKIKQNLLSLFFFFTDISPGRQKWWVSKIGSKLDYTANQNSIKMSLREAPVTKMTQLWCVLTDRQSVVVLREFM